MSIASVLMVEFQFTSSQIETEMRIVERAINLLAQRFTPSLIKVSYVSTYASSQRYFVFKQSAHAFLAYRLLEQFVYPIPVNGGIGLGEIIIAEDGQIRGNAWNQARRVLLEAKAIFPTAILYNANFIEDNLLNMQLYNWARLKEKQSPTARVFSLAYEIQIPLIMQDAVKTADWQSEDLNALEKEKYPLFHGNDKLQNYEQLDFGHRKATKWLEIHQNLDQGSFLVSGFFRRGYATAIANMTKTTRQNVDYHIKSGEFKLERNLAATILLQLEREERAIDINV